MTPVANLPPVSTTPRRRSYQQNRLKFATGINDTAGFASVVDTGGKLATNVNNTGGKFATGVNNAGGKLPQVLTTPVANSENNYQTADNLK
jgi:hypothetical protein